MFCSYNKSCIHLKPMLCTGFHRYLRIENIACQPGFCILPSRWEPGLSQWNIKLYLWFFCHLNQSVIPLKFSLWFSMLAWRLCSNRIILMRNIWQYFDHCVAWSTMGDQSQSGLMSESPDGGMDTDVVDGHWPIMFSAHGRCQSCPSQSASVSCDFSCGHCVNNVFWIYSSELDVTMHLKICKKDQFDIPLMLKFWMILC